MISAETCRASQHCHRGGIRLESDASSLLHTHPKRPPSCPTRTTRGTRLWKQGSPFQNPGVEMKLVSLAGDHPDQRTQAVWRTTDALGSSNMMLSGLILVTRNRFVSGSIHPAKLTFGSDVEQAVGVASFLARHFRRCQPTPASHQGWFLWHQWSLVGFHFTHPSRIHPCPLLCYPERVIELVPRFAVFALVASYVPMILITPPKVGQSPFQ